MTVCVCQHRRQPRRGSRGRIPTNILVGGRGVNGGGDGGDASPHHFGQGDPMPLIPPAAVAIGFNDLHL